MMPIKKNLCILAILLSMPLHGWTGRVLPITQHPGKNNEWVMLLGHNKKTGMWTDFQQDNDYCGKKANVIAFEALKTQTNGLYDLTCQPKTLFYLKDINKKNQENWFHVADVPFFSGSKLYTNAKNGTFDDFIWLPIKEAVSSSQFCKNKQTQTIDPYLYWFIKNHLSQAVTNKKAKPKEFIIQTNTTVWPSSKDNENFILFYAKNDAHYAPLDYYPLTNTYNNEVTIDDSKWKSTEHYYQAGKFKDAKKAYDEKLEKLSPGEMQKKFGQKTLQGDNTTEFYTNDNNLKRMWKALWKKFTQHKNLQTLLLDTQNKILVEDAKSSDQFYGAGADYQGLNHLGQMLMQLRDHLVQLTAAGKPIPHNAEILYPYKNMVDDFTKPIDSKIIQYYYDLYFTGLKKLGSALSSLGQ